jgi:hypothetical protein
MELPDFIEELEKAVTNAGSDKVWKRTVGDIELWFSPMSFVGQEKTNETMGRDDLGVNVVYESKRVTLSHSIVGIGKLDFRPWRNGTAVFPIVNKEGKTVKVPLEKYLYEKMTSWGGQFVDDVFSVYADLIESHQKDNLKDIRFENAKDPKMELLELEARASELRRQLNMPPLVEEGSLAAKNPDEPAGPVPDDVNSEGPAGTDPDFDPFKPVRSDGFPKHVIDAEAARSGERRHSASVQRPVSVQEAKPVPSAPEAPEPVLVTPEDDLFQAAQAAKPRPAIPLPPVREEDVLEAPAEKKLVPPPSIDRPPATSVNPRFARPSR